MSVAQSLASREFATLELTLDGELLTVTINRPEVLNALSPEVIGELRDVFGALRGTLGTVPDDAASPDWSVRGVILTGSGGRSFVAGADISAMPGMSPEEGRRFAAETQELTYWIETLQVPVIAAVAGFALGGGCELAMSCDYIFATDRAKFGQPEVSLGLIPGFGGTVRLAHHIGVHAARELIITGRMIDAEEALRLGLVLRVFPGFDELMAAAKASLLLAAAQSPTAVAAAKLATETVRALGTEAGLAAEADAFAERFGTPDMLEGTAAFLEKRKPSFPGL